MRIFLDEHWLRHRPSHYLFYYRKLNQNIRRVMKIKKIWLRQTANLAWPTFKIVKSLSLHGTFRVRHTDVNMRIYLQVCTCMLYSVMNKGKNYWLLLLHLPDHRSSCVQNLHRTRGIQLLSRGPSSLASDSFLVPCTKLFFIQSGTTLKMIN